MAEGSARTLLLLLARRFGPVPDALTAGISALPQEALDRLAKDLLDLSTLDHVERWLAEERP